MTLHIQEPSGDLLLEYALPVLVGFFLSVVFPATKHYENPTDKKKYRLLQLITLVAAIVGAKMAALAGDRFWPIVPLKNTSDWIYSGRSLLGGLLLGHFAAELAKPWVGYRLPPNNSFAAMLPFSVAVGRIGCLLAGCCRGIPYDGFFSVAYRDGIARHPEAIYEIVFQVSIALIFLRLARKKSLTGCLFSIYLIVYGVFRFGTEFIRATPKVWQGMSVYQGFAVVLLLVGSVELNYRIRRVSSF